MITNCFPSIILFDDRRKHLMPLTHTRAVAELRVGILTIKEKWQYALEQEVFIQTTPLLQSLYTNVLKNDDCIYINATYLPNETLAKVILKLSKEEAIYDKSTLIAVRKSSVNNIDKNNSKQILLPKSTICIKHLHDIISHQEDALKQDFQILTKGRISSSLPKSVYTVKGQDIFLDTDSTLHNVALNTTNGPIYIGKNVTIMEQVAIRGPVSIGNGSIIKMGATLYGGTTIGEYCKVGGEIKNTIIDSYSNKGHMGYLGDTIVGQWCNFGAGSTTSNMKNNYGSIRQWCYAEKENIDTKRIFCGLVMGDYSNCAIQTAFNAGSVVGLCTNILDKSPPKYVPDFTWDKQEYLLEKALNTIQNAMTLKGKTLTDEMRNIISKVFKKTTLYRKDYLS